MKATADAEELLDEAVSAAGLAAHDLAGPGERRRARESLVEAVAAIRAAVLAERERCAALIERAARSRKETAHKVWLVEYVDGLAAAIRAQEGGE